MRTYLKPEWMEWFIFNKDINQVDGRKKKNPKLIEKKYWRHCFFPADQSKKHYDKFHV